MAHPENLLIVGGLLLTACSSPDQKPKEQPLFSGEASKGFWVDFYPSDVEGMVDAVPRDPSERLTIGQAVSADNNGVPIKNGDTGVNVVKDLPENMGMLVEPRPGSPSYLWQAREPGGRIRIPTLPKVKVIASWGKDGKPVTKVMDNPCAPKDEKALADKLKQKPKAEPAAAVPVTPVQKSAETSPSPNTDTRGGVVVVVALIGFVTWLLRRQLIGGSGKTQLELVPAKPKGQPTNSAPRANPLTTNWTRMDNRTPLDLAENEAMDALHKKNILEGGWAWITAYMGDVRKEVRKQVARSKTKSAPPRANGLS